MPILRENGVFCVNTLGAGDEPIADIFAGRTGRAGSALRRRHIGRALDQPPVLA